MSNEIAEKKKDFSVVLSEKLTSVNEALPKDFNKTRFVQNALTVINENPMLAKINPTQLQMGLLKGAYLGLDFMSKECYLIPYGNSVQFQTDYKGETKLCKKYSIRGIKDIYSKVVREGDVFENTIIDNEPHVTFKPKPFNQAAIVGVFAICLFEDGGALVEEMSTEEVNDVRNSYSKMANGPTWKKSWSEMARKTVLRRLCKHIELDFESVEQKQTWDDASGMDFTAKKHETETEAVDVFDVEGEIIDE